MFINAANKMVVLASTVRVMIQIIGFNYIINFIPLQNYFKVNNPGLNNSPKPLNKVPLLELRLGWPLLTGYTVYLMSYLV